MAAHALQIEALAGGYGEITVVRGVTFAVSAGSVTCIAGRNGVGKTTLARLMTGSLTPSAGRVALSGRDVTVLSAHEHRTAGMGYAPQEGVVFDGLTVAENLTLHRSNRSLDGYAVLFERFPRILERRMQRAGTLSGGEKKIQSFCRAVAEDTALVVLDEPTEGVQPENIQLIAETIVEEKEQGRSFVIIEQNLTLVEAVADEALLMDHGQFIFATGQRDTMRRELSERMQI